MRESEWRRSESYYLAYQRGAVVCLLFAVATGAYFLAAVFGGLSGWLVFDGAIGMVALFFTALLAVSLVTLRGRLWRRRDPEAQLVLRDEWTRRNWNRACRIGFAAVMWAQLPLTFLMDRLAPAPSFSGMAGLSMTLGAGAFFASYLYVGRQPGDG
jgi:hypothetical protein